MQHYKIFFNLNTKHYLHKTAMKCMLHRYVSLKLWQL